MELVMFGFAAIVFLIVSLLLYGLLAWKLIESRKATAQVREAYKDIIDRDAEIARRETEIKRLEQERASLQTEYAQKSQSLNQEYSQARDLYENLKHEIGLLEETADLQSFGVYKPHYDFAASEEYKARLETIVEKQKALIKEERAILCAKMPG